MLLQKRYKVVTTVPALGAWALWEGVWEAAPGISVLLLVC